MKNRSKYILVDWHGPADYGRPFEELLINNRNEIDFYFYYDRRTGASRGTGKNTCHANCSHCFLKVAGAEEQFISIPEAIEVATDLRKEGYSNVDLIPSDSFGEEILKFGDDGSAQRIPGMGKVAWTSGVPLALSGWKEKLKRAWELGYRSLVINGHDIAGISVPIEGITRAPTLQKALLNMKEWNKTNPDEQFEWGFTFTLRSDTCNQASMEKMAAWAVENGVKVLRFNCFADFRGSNPEHKFLVPTRNDIVMMHKTLAELHVKYIDSPLHFSVSEDFGEAGTEAIEAYIAPEYRGQQVGVCRAAFRLFAITPINGTLRVVGCVDRMWPYLGTVEKSDGHWTIFWDLERIEQMRQARLNGSLYGCFGGVGRDRGNEEFNSEAGNQLLQKLTAE